MGRKGGVRSWWRQCQSLWSVQATPPPRLQIVHEVLHTLEPKNAVSLFVAFFFWLERFRLRKVDIVPEVGHGRGPRRGLVSPLGFSSHQRAMDHSCRFEFLASFRPNGLLFCFSIQLLAKSLLHCLGNNCPMVPCWEAQAMHSNIPQLLGLQKLLASTCRGCGAAPTPLLLLPLRSASRRNPAPFGSASGSLPGSHAPIMIVFKPLLTDSFHLRFPRLASWRSSRLKNCTSQPGASRSAATNLGSRPLLEVHIQVHVSGKDKQKAYPTMTKRTLILRKKGLIHFWSPWHNNGSNRFVRVTSINRCDGGELRSAKIWSWKISSLKLDAQPCFNHVWLFGLSACVCWLFHNNVSSSRRLEFSENIPSDDVTIQLVWIARANLGGEPHQTPWFCTRFRQVANHYHAGAKP